MTYPETRIILRDPAADEQRDIIVRHPGQPADYVHEDGSAWTWPNDQAWRSFGSAILRVYDQRLRAT